MGLRSSEGADRTTKNIIHRSKIVIDDDILGEGIAVATEQENTKVFRDVMEIFGEGSLLKQVLDAFEVLKVKSSWDTEQIQWLKIQLYNQLKEEGSSSLAWKSYTVKKGDYLYHSSKTAKLAIDRNRQMYFSLRPQDHNKYLFAFEVLNDIEVIDLTNLSNVQIIHSMMQKESNDTASNYLEAKTGASVKSGKVVAISGFKTIGRSEDGIVDQWFKDHNLIGWYGPLKIADEVMLTNIPESLVAEGKRFKM